MVLVPRLRVLLALTVVASAAPGCGFETRYFGGDAAAMDVSLATDVPEPDDDDADPDHGDDVDDAGTDATGVEATP